MKFNASNQRAEAPAQEQRITYCSTVAKDPCLLLAFPLYIIVISMLLPQWVYTKRMEKKLGRRYDFGSEQGTCGMLLFLILGLILAPLSLLYLLGTIIIDGLVDIYIWTRKKLSKGEFRSNTKVLQPAVM